MTRCRFDWINAYVPGGIGSQLGQILDVAYNIEYGAETSQQSALNFLYLIGYTGPGQFRLFGKSNEKFHVRGGNDQVVSALGDALAGQVQTGSELVAVKRTTSGAYSLTLKQGSKTVSVTVDHVVLALPFSILRSSVDWSKAGFGALKATAIREQGMGTNSKLHLQFSSRFWEDLGSNGETFSDRGYQNTWEVTRAQAGTSGILVDYTGGKVGASFGSGTPHSRAQQVLAQVEPVLPGATAAWNGRATVDFWPGTRDERLILVLQRSGSTEVRGRGGRALGNCHFAGGARGRVQGLNGAVVSGERARQVSTTSAEGDARRLGQAQDHSSGDARFASAVAIGSAGGARRRTGVAQPRMRDASTGTPGGLSASPMRRG
jgi:monoamine oxidase